MHKRSPDPEKGWGVNRGRSPKFQHSCRDLAKSYTLNNASFLFLLKFKEIFVKIANIWHYVSFVIVRLSRQSDTWVYGGIILVAPGRVQ